ncbi:MAG TPA: hypothetical protein VNQ80_19430 [Parapedobacter sp.]|uniref:hypothetical protein n=1 Tax=Parapedobacter sp. TaxID=1958893 RepID=UPI002BBB43B3|nr:hypothetical protein [Parapedobacter sp.]HWK59523.1 hypothetical protein [Parapedobacter sp.]
MKTSNKLLVAAVLLLVTVAVVNALTLKSQLAKMLSSKTTRFTEFPAASFNTIELSGTAPVGLVSRIIVKQADRFAVQYSNYRDFIHVAQDGEVLKVTIDHEKGYDGPPHVVLEIVIECPDLIGLTAIGTPLDSIDLPPNAHVLTRRHYQKSLVAVVGFRGAGMDIFAAEGMEVTLDSLAVDSLTARAERYGTVEIHRNELGYASLTVGDDATMTLDHAQIGMVSTAVAKSGQFIVKGTQLHMENVFELP